MSRRIRFALADATELARLRSWFTSLDQLRHWGGPQMGWSRDHADWLRMVQWPEVTALTMLDGNEVVGFGQLRYLQNDPQPGYCHLARLIIKPELRGQGLGAELVNGLMVRGSRLWRCEHFSLYVYQNNKFACQLYRRLGFVTAGHYAGCDEVLRMLR